MRALNHKPTTATTHCAVRAYMVVHSVWRRNVGNCHEGNAVASHICSVQRGLMLVFYGPPPCWHHSAAGTFWQNSKFKAKLTATLASSSHIGRGWQPPYEWEHLVTVCTCFWAAHKPLPCLPSFLFFTTSIRFCSSCAGLMAPLSMCSLYSHWHAALVLTLFAVHIASAFSVLTVAQMCCFGFYFCFFFVWFCWKCVSKDYFCGNVHFSCNSPKGTYCETLVIEYCLVHFFMQPSIVAWKSIGGKLLRIS